MGWELVDVLNVAEKPSVAKEISALMTGGNYRNVSLLSGIACCPSTVSSTVSRPAH